MGSWLFNGPQAANARTALLPTPLQRGPLADCCAALCGWEPAQDVSVGLAEDGGVKGLSSCADFDASLLARCWHGAPRCLDEALCAGVEAWALCAVALTCVARDAATAVAGTRGRALPLI